MTIAQIVYDNELHFGYSHEDIHEKVPSFFLVPLSDRFDASPLCSLRGCAPWPVYSGLASLGTCVYGMLTRNSAMAADAHMERYGRLHTDGRVLGGREAAREARAAPTCADALSPPDAWVRTHSCLILRVRVRGRVTLRCCDCRFYPGLVSPHLPQIGAGHAEPAGRIDAPHGLGAGSDASMPLWGGEPESGHGAGRRISASRPTRVIGTLEHPVTPMPPVRLHTKFK